MLPNGVQLTRVEAPDGSVVGVLATLRRVTWKPTVAGVAFESRGDDVWLEHGGGPLLADKGILLWNGSPTTLPVQLAPRPPADVDVSLTLSQEAARRAVLDGVRARPRRIVRPATDRIENEGGAYQRRETPPPRRDYAAAQRWVEGEMPTLVQDLLHRARDLDTYERRHRWAEGLDEAAAEGALRAATRAIGRGKRLAAVPRLLDDGASLEARRVVLDQAIDVLARIARDRWRAAGQARRAQWEAQRAQEEDNGDGS